MISGVEYLKVLPKQKVSQIAVNNKLSTIYLAHRTCFPYMMDGADVILTRSNIKSVVNAEWNLMYENCGSGVVGKNVEVTLSTFDAAAAKRTVHNRIAEFRCWFVRCVICLLQAAQSLVHFVKFCYKLQVVW